MKLVNIVSVLGLVAMVVACGSSQPSTTAGFNSMTSPGYIQPGYVSPGAGQAIYNSSGVLIGYKATVAIINHSTSVTNGQSLQFQAPTAVNAGDRIYINTNQSYYQIGTTRCLGVFNFNTNLRTPHPLTGASVTVNGQALSNGAVAPASGYVTLSAPLSQLSANCEVLNLQVFLPNAVYKESCTSVNGAPMQCP